MTIGKNKRAESRYSDTQFLGYFPIWFLQMKEDATYTTNEGRLQTTVNVSDIFR